MLSGYPKPRYPKYKRPKSVDDLMSKARELVNQPPGRHYHGLKPSYNIQSGNKILFVILHEYNPMVVEAMCRAMREKGARVDLYTLDSTPVAPPEELPVHEVYAHGKEEGEYSYYYTMVTNLIRTSTAEELVGREKYDMVIAGAAGAQPSVPFPWHRFNFVALEDFAGPLIYTPSDLHELINQKSWNQVLSCKEIRLTDPEGTDCRWTNYTDERPYLQNHLLARPCNIGHWFGGKDDCTGVIAGTLNHLGAFPNCKAYIEGGQVIKVEDGGKYGEAWQELLEKFKNVKIPPYALDFDSEPKYEVEDRGLFWYMECAIGTIPGVSRLPSEGLFRHYANCLHDRMRSGYLHHGFGPTWTWMKPMIKAGLPWVHLHLHSIFATLEGTNIKGETVTIIDKGHLTSLDGPEVRALAKKYGDPDELLTEIWFPALPGINVPGDYMRDYGQNPLPWIMKEVQEHPIWID
ncbi:hypothetical protein ACFLWZ_04615 [Chloroflexota bacterium]